MIPNSQLLKIQKYLIQTNVFFKFISFVNYYTCFCQAAAFVSGVVFSQQVVRIVIMGVIITYFTSRSSNNDLKTAVILTNFLDGLSATLGILAIRILYYTKRPILMIISSTASSIIALLLFYMREKNILESRTGLNIIGIILLSVGDSGLKPVLGEFLTEQLREHEEREGGKEEEQARAQKRVYWRFAWICSVFAGVFIYGFREWQYIFMWAGLIMVFTLILFLVGICSYHGKILDFVSSPFVIFRVVKNAVKRRRLMYPSSADQFFDNHYTKQLILSPRVKFFRWLDKAALKESPDAEEAANAGKICTVAEVRESKLVLKLVPMWISFLVLEIVRSGIDTFLPEQGNNMQSRKFMTLLLAIQPIFSGMISYLSQKLISKLVAEKYKGKAQIARIFIGMVVSTFCCTVAWRVEVHRLIIVKDKGLLDKPDEEVPMSIFWLIPQYCLLGLMEGLARDGLDEFVCYHLPNWKEDHASAISDFIVGIGSFLNIAFVYANKSVFASTLNRSRLDKYYMRLTILAYINMCYYFYLATLHMQWDDPSLIQRATVTHCNGNDMFSNIFSDF